MPELEEPETGRAEVPAASEGPRQNGKMPGKKVRVTLSLTGFVCLIGIGAPLAYKFEPRAVIQIGIPESQMGNHIQETLEKWKPEEHGRIELEAIPLSYEDLLFSETDTRPPPFDVIMVDDPWLAQLAHWGRLAAVPESQFRDFFTGFAPEFLHVAYYQDPKDVKTPRRPALAALTLKGQTHPNLEQLDKLHGSYTLYGLPYVGNVQVIARHSPASGKDDLRVHLAAGHAGWPSLVNPGTQFYMRMGSNNSAVADFLPLLWSEGGCLIAKNAQGQEISGLSDSGPALAALDLSLKLVASGPIQYARFKEEDVQTYLKNTPDSIGVSWLAYRSGLLRQASPQNGNGGIRWYSMPTVDTEVKNSCNSDVPLVDTGKRSPGTLGAWLLAVNSSSKQRDEAWKFVHWVLQQVRDVKTPPSAAECSDEIEPVGNDPLNGFPTPFEDQLTCGSRKAVRNSRPRPAHPRWREIEDALGFRVRQVHWGTLKSTEAMHDVEGELNEILTRTDARQTR